MSRRGARRRRAARRLRNRERARRLHASLVEGEGALSPTLFAVGMMRHGGATRRAEEKLRTLRLLRAERLGAARPHQLHSEPLLRLSPTKPSAPTDGRC